VKRIASLFAGLIFSLAAFAQAPFPFLLSRAEVVVDPGEPPAPWVERTVDGGSLSFTCDLSYDTGVFTEDCTGGQFFGTADHGAFWSAEISGDWTLTIRVTDHEIDGTPPAAKVFVGARQSLSANSANAHCGLRSNLPRCYDRPSVSASTSTTYSDATAASLPYCLRFSVDADASPPTYRGERSANCSAYTEMYTGEATWLGSAHFVQMGCSPNDADSLQVNLCDIDSVVLDDTTAVDHTDDPPPTTTDIPEYDDPLATTDLGAFSTVSINSQGELATEVAGACGRILALDAGNWTGLTISKNCTATTPLIIRGASNLTSVFNNTRVNLTGSYIYLDGLKFTYYAGDVSPGSAQLRCVGTGNKVFRSEFTDWGFPMAIDAGGNGSRCEVAYNFIHAPRTWVAIGNNSRMGIRTTIGGTNPTANFPYDFWIHHNIFYDFPTKPDPGPSGYSSGQDDAIEWCETNGRAFTATIITGTYITDNLIHTHRQGHGTIDLKCQATVLRNTFTNTAGRIDKRYGGRTRTIIASNYLDDSSDCITISGGLYNAATQTGNNIVVGNRCGSSKSIKIRAGQDPCDEHNPDSNDNSANCDTFVAGNNSPIVVGHVYSSDTTASVQAVRTRIEEQNCNTVTNGTFTNGNPAQSGTINDCAEDTDFAFTPAVQITCTNVATANCSTVGPNGFANASTAYKNARVP
jgi:hypothetical protein